ncbi:MAG: dTDP-4-amino-4,6-dideoxygalactose transaminase [Magnetococcus sp. WYHC-3]
MIPFNQPAVVGQELTYIGQAVAHAKTSGNGRFTQKCQRYLEKRYGFNKCLLTTSCTDALEMAAILADLHPGDEVIMPSFTFVSTALAFVRQGATIVFADSSPNHPNMDAEQIKSLITPRTKVIVPMHYGGVACDMGRILALASKHQLLVISDSAQALDAYYGGALAFPEYPWLNHLRKHNHCYPLGGVCHMACFSFHETKNIQCGEGGMLTINDPRFVRRAEIIWDKGTNRADYNRGEVAKYEWVDVGSSFLPSEITAAFLWGQLEQLNAVQERRLHIWNRYAEGLASLAAQGLCVLPQIPPFATNNAHVFYLVCNSPDERSQLITFLRNRGVTAAFHYSDLHSSPFYRKTHATMDLVNCRRFANCLLRLPLFYGLKPAQAYEIIATIKTFYAAARKKLRVSSQTRGAKYCMKQANSSERSI